MPIFLFLVGYTTMIANFGIGIKAANFLFPMKGNLLFVLYSVIVFSCFIFVENDYALMLMNCSGVVLLTINIIGVFRMRENIFIMSGLTK